MWRDVSAFSCNSEVLQYQQIIRHLSIGYIAIINTPAFIRGNPELHWNQQEDYQGVNSCRIGHLTIIYRTIGTKIQKNMAQNFDLQIFKLCACYHKLLSKIGKITSNSTFDIFICNLEKAIPFVGFSGCLCIYNDIVIPLPREYHRCEFEHIRNANKWKEKVHLRL